MGLLLRYLSLVSVQLSVHLRLIETYLLCHVIALLFNVFVLGVNLRVELCNHLVFGLVFRFCLLQLGFKLLYLTL